MAPQWSTRRLRTGEATQLENGAQGGSNGASTRRGGTTVELEEQSNGELHARAMRRKGELCLALNCAGIRW
jgi:hypothetical protein